MFHFHFGTFQVIKEVPEGRQTLLFTVFLAASEWWAPFVCCCICHLGIPLTWSHVPILEILVL